MAGKRKSAKGKEIDLEIKVKDFGPISEGVIKLKPLTIFIGPNNSGKSYAAMLIHSIFESYYPPDLIKGLHFLMRQRIRGSNFDSAGLFKDLPGLKGQIENLKEGLEIEIKPQIMSELINKIFKDIYERRFSYEIARSYACNLNELIRIKTNFFKIMISFNSGSTSLKYQTNEMRIEEYPKSEIKMRIKAFDAPQPTISVNQNEEIISIEAGALWKNKDQKMFMSLRLVEIILDSLFSMIFKNIASPCFYLPAARSGILQGHKSLAAEMFKQAPFVGIEKLGIPRFSGVVSDFISSVITLPGKKGSFYKLAQDFERELILGEIIVKAVDEYLYPEIKYKFQKTEIPLHRSSSTVSELAPLFLYLKHNIEPGNILIIEEPEAHLHPENQRILAKYLVRLIREGVYIIITTHSEFLLEQLSSFLILSKISQDKRKERYKYKKDDFLAVNEISGYVFNYDFNTAGYKITTLEITEDEGISQGEFQKIHEALYDEKIKLLNEIENKQ